MTHDGIAAGEARLALIPEASVLRTPAAVDGDGGGSEMQPVEGGRAGGPPPAPSSGFAHLSPAECSAHLSPAAPGGGGLTFDQALTQYVGERPPAGSHHCVLHTPAPRPGRGARRQHSGAPPHRSALLCFRQRATSRRHAAPTPTPTPPQPPGDFGRGQILNFVLASLAWVPNAMLILMLVFSSGSPVKDHDWKCTDAADAACAAALAAADPAAAGFCALGRGQWAWTRPQHTLIAQFDLVCKGERAPGQQLAGLVANTMCTACDYACSDPPTLYTQTVHNLQMPGRPRPPTASSSWGELFGQPWVELGWAACSCGHFLCACCLPVPG